MTLLTRTTVLIVDDERSMRETLAIALEEEGYEIALAASIDEAFAALRKFDVSVAVTDMRMPGGDGVEFLRQAKLADESIEVILMTAFGTAESAVEAMKLGAYDYLTKPFNLDELKVLIRRALERRTLAQDNIRLRQQVKSKSANIGLVAKSPKMQDIVDVIQRIASRDITVLIAGESGVGKEVIAQTIHASGQRADGPFVPVNCGALPENLVEAELFGYERGAFTGADRSKEGLLEHANGGTMFLDEVGELPLPAQVKLLRVLQEQTVRRLGGSKERKLNIRFISATNRPLEEHVRSGEFREDLFYRLNVFRIDVPPLRERKEDIPELISACCKKIASRLGVEKVIVDPLVSVALSEYAFPGNVRELENILERAMILAQNGQITLELLPVEVRISGATTSESAMQKIGGGFNLETYLMGIERRYFQEALTQAGGVRTKAAELLGLSFRQFRYKAKKLQL